jgi:hypothetical protein
MYRSESQTIASVGPDPGVGGTGSGPLAEADTALRSEATWICRAILQEDFDGLEASMPTELEDYALGMTGSSKIEVPALSEKDRPEQVQGRSCPPGERIQ